MSIYGELCGVDDEAFAERDVVAGGVLGVDERPATMDVAPDGVAGSALVEAWAYGWGEDVLAVGDVDPDPDRGKYAFAVVPVDVSPDDPGKGLVLQAGDQGCPFLRRDGPRFQGVASVAVVGSAGGVVQVLGDAADGGIEVSARSAVELLFDDSECVDAGVVGNTEELGSRGSGTADADLREVGCRSTAKQLGFDFGDSGEMLGVPLGEQVLRNVLDAEADWLRRR